MSIQKFSGPSFTDPRMTAPFASQKPKFGNTPKIQGPLTLPNVDTVNHNPQPFFNTTATTSLNNAGGMYFAGNIVGSRFNRLA